MHSQQKTKMRSAWKFHFQNRFRWIEENENILGKERSENLRNLLRHQVIEWLDLARWNRQWERYYDLREYAKTLPWPEGPPDILNGRIYPKFIYKIKDFIDSQTKNYL
jgi:hypothetical protein